MLSFMAKNGNTAIISIISCEQSRINATINGGDMISLDAMLNDINKDPKITHAVLRLTYGEDEKKVLDFYNDITARNNMQKKEQNESEHEDSSKQDHEYSSNNSNNNVCTCSTCDNNVKQKDKRDFICPECGSNDALVDKDGNKYPCLSCIQIDIGKKLQDKYSKEYCKVVDKNNELIKQLVEALKK